MKMFRLLRADEIECRVSRCTEKGAVLLLYKTARTDADLLDETVGSTSWENDFKIVDGVLYGGIGITFPVDIHHDDGSVEHLVKTIWKWDAGTESNTEAEKGRASDAFKRAGFKWGLGRELYSAPFVFIPKAKCNIVERNGKFQCFDNFEVVDIAYTEDRISYLRIGLNGLTVFEWGDPKENPDDRICEVCGRPIKDGKKNDGSPWDRNDIAIYTRKRFGRELCVECAKVAFAKEKEIHR